MVSVNRWVPCIAGPLTFLVVAAGLLAAARAANEPTETVSFPGAEGFGAHATGGRGGAVYEVTTLEDSGPGSLRAALGGANRTIVFRVSGTIALKAPLIVTQPNITIAGQTAPGDGICLRNYPFSIRSHDVVVRYLRSRLGDTTGQQADCITLDHGVHDVIVDHCSATWSVDEALSLAGNVTDMTVQWCLIAEALDRSKHAKGAHGYGSLARANGRVSLHHNLWAHNDARNPRLGDNYGRPPYPTFDVRNNVIYDFGSACSGLTQGVLKVNYVANFIRPGPSSKAKFPISVGAPSDMLFYIRDNVVDGDDGLSAENARFFNHVELSGKRQVQTVTDPFPAPPVQTLPAREAYETVLAGAGSTRPARDSVDARIVAEVRQRKGAIIDSQTQVGGWPDLRSEPPPADGDHDGMPDAWEARHGLDPADPADGPRPAAGAGGTTHLERYLAELASDPATHQ